MENFLIVLSPNLYIIPFKYSLITGIETGKNKTCKTYRPKKKLFSKFL